MTEPKKIGSYDLELFTRRVIADCLLEATPRYWRRRADQLDMARPRSADFVGHAAPGRIAAIDDRLRLSALACRQKAALIEAGWI